MLEVWQNSASFGDRPIGSAVEVLMTKIIIWQLSVLPIVVFFVDTAVSVSPPQQYVTSSPSHQYCTYR
jgi:hypothetical protein